MTHATTNTRLAPLLTPEDLSDMLQMPLRTLDDWRYRHVGPDYIRIGKRVRYRLSSVEAWLERLENDAA